LKALVTQTAILIALAILIPAFSYAGNDVSFPEGYTITIPDSFTTSEKKKDECNYTNPEDNADIDFIVLEVPKGQSGDAKELKEIVFNDLESFIPGYKVAEEKQISLEAMEGYFVRAEALGENEEPMIMETSVCISSDKRHSFILNLIYPADLKAKYADLSEKTLETVRKTK